MSGWPGKLFALSAVLFLGGVGLLLAFGEPEGETAEAIETAGAVLLAMAFTVFPLGVLTALASILQRPGDAAQRPGRALAVFCFVAWLAALGLVWAGIRGGGGGIDGPCSGGAIPEGRHSPGSCESDPADWPPGSVRVVSEGTEGTFERIYPNTPEVIALITLAALPFLLWPPALWLTAERPGRRPPLGALICLLAGSVALMVGAALLLDEWERGPPAAEPTAALPRAAPR